MEARLIFVPFEAEEFCDAGAFGFQICDDVLVACFGPDQAFPFSDGEPDTHHGGIKFGESFKGKVTVQHQINPSLVAEEHQLKAVRRPCY